VCDGTHLEHAVRRVVLELVRHVLGRQERIVQRDDLDVRIVALDDRARHLVALMGRVESERRLVSCGSDDSDELRDCSEA
jgi:hypothetical protein